MVLWCDGAHDAPENMRRDATLLARFEGGESAEPPPVLRLFRFDPPGITLGHGQHPERDLDLERCRADGVRWAVRPTGGRAIFHAGEWTFSLSAALDHPEWGGSLGAAYAAVSRLIAASLVRLGVPAELAARRHGLAPPIPRAVETGNLDPSPTSAASAACFASTARHEIVLGGRKLVGSAQRRNATALLQQGSVLLDDGHLSLVDYLAVPDARRATLRATLSDASAGAGVHLGADRRLERWADAIAAELGSRVQRFDGEAGARLLTLEKGRFYTSPVSQVPTRPGIAGRSHDA
jgi:lipoate-protein ligase A